MVINLMIMYWKKQKRAWKLALIWYKRAAEKGHKRAREQENKIYAKNVYLDYNGHGIVSLISFSNISTS
jgi:TPR repeat protein